MAKKIVPLVTNSLYHVYNRGTDKRNIFDDQSDYIRFYRSLNFFNSIEPAVEFQRASNRRVKSSERLVSIQAYCLLNNHFHLILEQLVDDGISEFMKRVGAGYTGYYNEKNSRTGVLFQGKFKRVLVEEDEQFNYLFAYVNENHIVHGLKVPNEVYATSSFHYRNIFTSSLINREAQSYDVDSAVNLAKEIYSRRKELKSILLEL